MRYETFKLWLVGCLILSGCPANEREGELDPELREADDDMGRAGRAAAGKGGKGGLLGGSAGKGGSAGRTAEPDDEVAGSGASGSFAGAAAVGGKGGGAAGGSAGGGAAGAVAGGAGSRAGAGGAAGGGDAGRAGGAGTGGKPAAGSGGAAGSGTGVPSGTKLTEITTDAQAEAICDALRAKIDPSDFEALDRGACTLEGLTGELQGNGDCAALTQACLNAPVPVESPLSDNSTASDFPSCAGVTVDEYFACTLASIEASSAFFGKLSCQTDIQTLTDIPTPAACTSVYRRCPELGSGSGGGSGGT